MNPLWAKNASLTVLGNWRRNYRPRFRFDARRLPLFHHFYIPPPPPIRENRIVHGFRRSLRREAKRKGFDSNFWLRRAPISLKFRPIRNGWGRNAGFYLGLTISCPLARFRRQDSRGERSSRSTRLIYKSNGVRILHRFEFDDRNLTFRKKHWYRS